MALAASSARLEARITPDLHSMLKRAAELQGRTLTDFVVSAVHAAAQEAIAQSQVLALTMADQQAFADALIAPPKLAPAMKRALTRRKKILREA